MEIHEEVRGVVGELEVEAGMGMVKTRERRRKVARVDAMKMAVILSISYVFVGFTWLEM